jgi:SulP family sulfate permease
VAALGPQYARLGAVSGLYATIIITLVPPFVGSSAFQFNGPGPAAAGILSGLTAAVLANPLILEASGGLADAAEFAVRAMFLCAAFAGPILEYVPLAAVAGVLGVMALGFFDPWPFELLRRVRATDDRGLRAQPGFTLGLLVVVTATVVLADLVTAIAVGLGLELARFILGSGGVLVRGIKRGPALHSNVVRLPREAEAVTAAMDGVALVSLQGSLFFGNTDHLAQRIDDLGAGLRAVILDFRRVSDIDASAALMLRQIDGRLSGQGTALLQSYLPADSELRRSLGELGLEELAASGRMLADNNAALSHVEAAVLAEQGLDEDAREIPLDETIALAGWSAGGIARLGMTRREVGAGERLIAQGDDADGMYVITRGRMRVSIAGDGGRPVSLVEYGPGVSVGELALVSGHGRTADVHATVDSVLWFLPRETFERLVRDEGTLAARLLVNLSGSMARRLGALSEVIRTLENG